MFSRSRKNQRVIIQAAYRPQRRVARSIHISAFLAACVITALAFSIPVERATDFSGLPELTSAPVTPDLFQFEPYADDQQESVDENRRGWHSVEIQPGDTLSHLFTRLGLPTADLYVLLNAGDEAQALEQLRPGQTLDFHINPETHQLQEVVLATSPTQGLRLIRDANRFSVSRYQHTLDRQTYSASGFIQSTFQQAAHEAGLPRTLAARVPQLLTNQVNFSRDLRSNDYFNVIYETHYFDNQRVRNGDILAVELILSGRPLRIIGFPNEQGTMQYFTPKGESLDRAFIRFPVNFHRVSSSFAPNRLHPILGIRRPHNGIDLAAPTGTPIKAASDGVVAFVGRRGGYGRTIIINHGRGYKTLYAHLSSYASSIRPGQQVEQGEFIGRVGQSGMATGPHLHYEVHVNGRPRNPATVELPGYPPLSETRLAEFKAHAQPLLAQIEQQRPTQIASRSGN